MAARICIVEDESIVAHDIKRQLERAGYKIVGIFSSGEELLDNLKEKSPELVLMDVKLRGKLDGIETSRIIKSKYNLPVVMLTAFADDTTIERTKETAPFGYILKPFEEKELNTAVEMALYRYKLEKKLQESEEQYRSFFEEDLSGDFIASGNGRILQCNSAFLEIFRFPSREKAMDSNINDLFPEEALKDQFWHNLRTKKKLRLKETEFITWDKKPITILANVIGSFTRDNELFKVKGYLIDMTEQKELEKQLRQSQKMEAVGRLAGGVAHDFNNILTVIIGYSTILEDKIKEGMAIDNELDGIYKAAVKATALTRQLLAFSRRQVLNPKVVDLNTLIRDMEKMIRRIMVKDVAMSIRLDDRNPRIFIDAGQLEQVLMNLVVNAKDAMPKGGKLLLKTKMDTIKITENTILGELPKGEYAVLQVTDSGVGIPEEILPQIFEPFFTTKESDKGTGLGLSTVYGIVKQSGGFIRVKSEKDKGTVFEVLFPVSEGLLPEERQETATRPSLEGQETVLIVEDEEDVRVLISRVLSRYGYTVLEAKNPGEALLICETYENPIDILISDIVMQHISGIKLAERLKKIKSELKVLLISGYPDKTIREKTSNYYEDAFLSKPFTPEELISEIRRILDSDKN